MKPFKSRPLKEKIFIAFLSYSILSFLIAVVSFLLFRQMEELEKNTSEISKVFNKTINAIKYGQDFFIYDVNNIDFYKTGKSTSLTQQKKLLQEVEKTSDKLLTSDELDNFYLKRYLSTYQNILKDYRSIFDTIKARIRRKGYGEYGYIGALKESSEKINKYKNINMKLMEDVLLYESELNTTKDSVFYKRLLSKKKRLDNLLKKNDFLSESEKENIKKNFNEFRNNFKKVIKIDNQTGLKDLSGSSFRLKRAVDVVDALVNSIEKLSKERKQDIIKRLQIIMVIIIAFSVSMALLLTLAFKFVMQQNS